MSKLDRILSSRQLVGNIQQAAEDMDIGRDDCAELAIEIGLALLISQERPQNVCGFDIDAAIENRRGAGQEARRLVTGRSLPYLDYGIVDYFYESRILRKTGIQLERKSGLYLIGQLISFTRGQLGRLHGVDQRALAEFERHLCPIGLSFGMVSPRWRDPGFLPV